MALTKIPRNLSSTPSISDSGTGTALTIDGSGNITVANDLTITGTLGTGSANYATETYVDNSTVSFGGVTLSLGSSCTLSRRWKTI